MNEMNENEKEKEKENIKADEKIAEAEAEEDADKGEKESKAESKEESNRQGLDEVVEGAEQEENDENDPNDINEEDKDQEDINEEDKDQDDINEEDPNQDPNEDPNADPNEDPNVIGIDANFSRKSVADENLSLLWMLEKMKNSELISSIDDEKVTTEVKQKMLHFLEKKEISSIYIKYHNQKLIGFFNLNDELQRDEVNYNFCFFIKKDQKMPINHHVIELLVVYDCVFGNINKFILDKMNSKIVPYILELSKWPEGIRKDLINNMHKFMISLSQAYFSDNNQIFLYIPQENISNKDLVIRDKDLVSRLEGIMIEWTTQIRDFVTNEETVTNREDFHVLNEIDFWDLRNTNLTNISAQLENKELLDIIEILREVKKESSDNWKNFMDIKNKILEGKTKAEEILKFIKILKEPCKEIIEAQIKEVPPILFKILDKIRVISEYCKCYNTSEKVAELLRKVSNQLMHKFTEKIQENIKHIVEEYSEHLHSDIRLIRWCINEWKTIFNNVRDRIALYEKNPEVKYRWSFESKDNHIFYDIDSFEKRCQNLEDICLCQLQFGKNKSDLQPIFGGTKFDEIQKQLRDIEDKFDDFMKILFKERTLVLDLKMSKWQEDYRSFSKSMEDLEDMYKNTISSAFKRINTVEEQVNYVENFYSLARLKKIKNFIKNEIALEVVAKCSEELQMMNAKNETKGFQRMIRQSTEGGNAIWAKFLSLKMEDFTRNLARMNQIFNPRKPKEEYPYMKDKKMDDLREQMKHLEASIKPYLTGEQPGIKEELEMVVKINDTILDDKLKIPLVTKLETPEKSFFTKYQCNYPSSLLHIFAINNCVSRLEEYSIPQDVIRKINDVDERTRQEREAVISVVRDYNNLVDSIKSSTEKAIFQEEFNRLINENISRIQNRTWSAQGNFSYLHKFQVRIREVNDKIHHFNINANAISDILEQISKRSFFTLEKTDEIYEKRDFEVEQKKIRQNTSQFIQEKSNEILSLFLKSYKFIENVDDPEVFRGFKNYLEETSEKYYDAVGNALFYSVNNMKKTMLGADKNSNPPVFLKINIHIIEKKIWKEKAKNYEFSPTWDSLKECIEEIQDEMYKTASNTPDIIKMFFEANEAFHKKILMKKQEEKEARPLINNITNISKNPETFKSDDRKKKDNKKISTGNSPSKTRSSAVDTKQGMSILNLNSEKVEVTKGKFPKADEERRAFKNDLKSKHLEIEFNNRLENWVKCKRINEMMGLLIEEENVNYVNHYFSSYLTEGCKSKSLITKISESIKERKDFADSLSSADGSDDTIPQTIHTYLFLQFDATPVKHRLIDMCENIINFILQLTTEKTKEEFINKVNFEFSEHERRFKNEPMTQDDYKYLYDELNKCKGEEKLFRFRKIQAAHDLVELIIATNQTKGIAEDLVHEVENLEKRKQTYEVVLIEAETMLGKARMKLANSVDKDEVAFRTKVEEKFRDFNKRVLDKISAQTGRELEEVDVAQRTLIEFERYCKELKQEEIIVKKGLKLFYEDLRKNYDENYQDLIAMETAIIQLDKIWQIRRRMCEYVDNWYTTQFYDFDLVEMEANRVSIENELKPLAKEMNSKDIYKTMKEKLELYKNTIAVLVLLRDEAMKKPSHWEEIASKMGVQPFSPEDIDFTFLKILDYNFHLFPEIIQERVNYAKGQQQIGRGIENIRNEWRNNQLEFEFNENRRIFKLLANTKMNNDLESDLTTIATYKATPYYEDFKDKIDGLENDLNKLSDVYVLLRSVLEKWTYLIHVFDKDDKEDMEHQAGIESGILKASTKEFMDILRVFARVKVVMDCFLQKNLENDLSKIYKELVRVKTSLYANLEAKRGIFTRFYFLSNDDFLELLGNSQEEKVINFHLSKLFSGIEKVEIGDLEKDEKAMIGEKIRIITHFKDIYDEKVKLDRPIQVTALIQSWMNDLRKYMVSSLEKIISQFYISYSKKNLDFEFNFAKLEDLDKIFPNGMNGQTLITLSQLFWRKKVERELLGDKSDVNIDNALKGIAGWLQDIVKQVVDYLGEKKNMPNKKDRIILYNYILITKYNLEVTKHLLEESVRSVDNYNWQKLLKLNMVQKRVDINARGKNKNVEDLQIVQAEVFNNVIPYSYEYIGNKERLVMTSLTERSFLTMITAMSFHRGCSLQGPAGTGKTETVKDLGRNLAKYVIVFNCSNKNSYSTMETLFMGVLRTGGWICFDEFNRIEIEVLSVVRIQLNAIYDGLRSGAKSIAFRNNQVEINRELGVFITTNPSYQFRSEMPDNLKTLFRPIAVNVADKKTICEMRFYAEGFCSTLEIPKVLALNLVTSFDVMEQQLSKQPHYDFSLRTLISILYHAGMLKKNLFNLDDNMILRVAITDIMKPKLVVEDEEIFNMIMNSIFSDDKDSKVSNETSRDTHFRDEIKDEINAMGYCGSTYLVNQIQQLHSYMKIKHAVMLVGDSVSGKTTSLKILQSLCTSKAKKDVKGEHPEYAQVHITRLYPKSIEIDELYGKQQQYKGEQGSVGVIANKIYTEGLLPYHLKELCSMKKEDSRLVKWLVLDGPVDSLWIESLNTLLDETKMLSLPNGYRINLKSDVKIVFEADGLSQATPATVSRVGLIFCEANKLSWFPIARKWLDLRVKNKEMYDNIAKWFDKYVYGILSDIREAKLTYLVNYHENFIILSFIKLFEAFYEEVVTKSSSEGETGESKETLKEKSWEITERVFIFAFMWAVAGSMDETNRSKAEGIIRKYCSTFPPSQPIYDFLIIPDKDDWVTWEDKMMTYSPTANIAYNDIFVPTLDITRVKSILQTLIKAKPQVNGLVIGSPSSGKSSVVNKLIFKTIGSKYLCANINLSYAISPFIVQKLVESNFEKRNNKLFPPSNKQALLYVEDLNLPKKDQFGCQAIVEMLRQCVELDGWYGVEEKTFVNINSMLLMGSTTVRGAKSEVSQRFLSKFVLFAMQNPDDSTKNKIFGTIVSHYLSSLGGEEIKKLTEGLPAAMINLYNFLFEKDNYLPTPNKCHYIFTLRDITKIFESFSKPRSAYGGTREYFIRQWVHESFRGIHDRFILEDDRAIFVDAINRQLETTLGTNIKECMMKENKLCVFVDFIGETYEDVIEFEEIKKAIYSKVDTQNAFSQMVFFDQAINYICIINRIMNKNCGGHGMLLGLGASGRASYVKIAAQLSGYFVESMKSASDNEAWNQFLIKNMTSSGLNGTKIAMLINESDLFDEMVVDDLYNVITSGLSPHLLLDSWETIKSEAASVAVQNMAPEPFVAMFKKNCMDNLKVFFTLSPLGGKLRNYCRTYPNLINYSTTVYLTDWPESALKEVAQSFVKIKFPSGEVSEEVKSERETLIIDVADIFAQIHLSVREILLKMDAETKRKAYFTSTSFVTFIDTFNKCIDSMHKTIERNIAKYTLGLQKISVGKVKINTMTLELEEKNKEESLKYKDIEKLIDEITLKKEAAKERETDLERKRADNEGVQKFFAKVREDSKKDLEEAQKPMQEAINLIENELSREKLAQFKNMNDAHNSVKEVFYGLLAIFGRPSNWGEVRSYLQELKYEDLKNIDSLPITERGNLPKIQSFSKNFNRAQLKRQSDIMPVLADYILNVEKYFKAKWNAEVKQRNLDEANKQMLHAAQEYDKLAAELTEIKMEVEMLEKERTEKETTLNLIKEETKNIKLKLERASFLITAFKTEETRWSESLEKNEDLLKNLRGNTILASAILTYYGVFSRKYRDELYKNYWINILKSKKIAFTENFEFLEFISNTKELDDWKNNCGLKDKTFLENGVIIKNSLSFSLIIDPQDQALTWIKKISDKKINMFTPQMPNYIAQIKRNLGDTIIINNIGENLGQELQELLRQVTKDKTNLYLMTKMPNPNFQPSVSSCVNIINFIVNDMGLEEQMLTIVVEMEKRDTENQIRTSRDDIFHTRIEIDKSEEKILNYLNDADDNFLEQDSLIRDLKLLKETSIKATDQLKALNQNMEKILTSREEYRPLARKVSKFFFVLYSMNNIDHMYEFSLDSYQTLFRRSVNEISEKHSNTESAEERTKSIEKNHILNILKFTNQCLFEKHRLLFGLQLSLALIKANEEEKRNELEKIGFAKLLDKRQPIVEEDDDPLRSNNKTKNVITLKQLGIELFKDNEFEMLMQSTASLESIDLGGKGLQKPNWINDDNSWKFIISMENKISDLKGIISNFTNNSQDWNKWYTSKEIEDLPVDWEQRCKGDTNVRKLLFIKALRPDKFSSALRAWISRNLGIEMKDITGAFSLKEMILKEVSNTVPLMIIHGAGIDPSEAVQKIWEEEVNPANTINKEAVSKDGTQNKYYENDLTSTKKSLEKATDKKDEKDKKEKKCLIYTLNQDQLEFTKAEIEEFSKIGGWIYLANTHLTLNSIPDLEKKLDDLKEVHPDFRLIISTNPHPKFPISFLQRCKKITLEAPKGIAVNMAALFEDLMKETVTLPIEKNDNKAEHKNAAFAKMIYSLAMFHSILIERKKYKSYGWTAMYDFNNSDFKICFDLIKVYVAKMSNPQDFPWKALQELIEINYGSRFTNNKDIILLNTYSNQFFNPKILEKNYNFSPNPEFNYPMPDEAIYERYKNTNISDSQFLNKNDFYMRVAFYKEEVKKLLPKEDPPEIFGFHFNAEISALVQDNLELMKNIRAMSPEMLISESGASLKDNAVLKKVGFAMNKLPETMNLESAKQKIYLLDKNANTDPILHVLFQETLRYNSLILLIKKDLKAVENALKGNVILTPNLETKINWIYEDKVPINWLSIYNSTKTLAAFILDLGARVEFFSNWLSTGLTNQYCLGYFSNPVGFITAVKQKYSLENKISFNKVKLDFKVVLEDEISKFRNSYLIKNVWVEGGVWDKKNGGLKDENIQDLTYLLPFISMTPVNEDLTTNANALPGLVQNPPLRHMFPLYYIPIRGEFNGRNSYVIDICLNIVREKDKDGLEKTDNEYIDYWIKKGTCLLLSKND